MSDGNKLLSQLDCKFGAPMGRRKIIKDKSAKVRLFLVRMVDQCYDVGGAYWGIGKNPLYAAIGEGFQYFLREQNRKEAKKNLQKDYPELRFFR